MASKPVLYDADGSIVNQRRASGMLREWTFALYFVHQAARVKLQYVPQWTSTFIDPDDVPDLSKLDRDVSRCPLLPYFGFKDLTAGDKTSEAWEELSKSAKFYYAHLSKKESSLTDFCIHCVRSVLMDTRVVEVDKDANLKELKLGHKLHTTFRLGGEQSFAFRYRIEDRATLTNDYCFAIGCIINNRGYFVTVSCAREAELELYVAKKFLPHLCDPAKFHLDQDVTYSEPTYQLLRDQQDLFGELQFFDQVAAVAFAIPMHPLTVRPDYSPTQTVGVGSLACMTLELSVHQRLLDDFVDADTTGMPKHKANAVYIFLDIENVSKNDYPSIMSVEEYSSLKTKRLLQTFTDAKLVGLPTSLSLGSRCGRSATGTFHYDGEGSLRGSVVKAMMVSTLIGNHGVTATYFTKLGQGLFDAHLYIFQQLLKNVTFFSERDLVENFSRFKSVNIRLTDQDMARAYSGAPAAEQAVMQQHLKALQASNDGRCEGARIVVPDEAAGGLKRPSIASTHGSNNSPVDELLISAAAFGGFSASSAVPPTSLRADHDDPSAGANIASRTSPLPIPADMPLDATRIPVDGIAHLTQVNAWDSVDVRETSPAAGASAPTSGGEAQAARDAPLSDGVAESDSNAATTTTLAASGTMGSANAAEGAGSPSDPLLLQSQSPSNAQTPLVVVTAGDAGAAPGSAVAENDDSPARRHDHRTRHDGREVSEADREKRINDALHNDDGDVYFGPSLRDVYVHCCNDVKCKPNSYLLSKLPDNPRFTASILELDMSTNYLGTSGFVALLMLVGHLPKVQRLFFNDMTLGNEDVKHLCDMLVENESVTSIHLRNNPKVNIASTQHLARLIRKNPRITSLSLTGTSLGTKLIAKLEADAAANGQPPHSEPQSSP